MKKLLLIIATVFVSLLSQGQFTKANLQATGLTCAMCSNAINKALQKVSFVESVKSDIKNSAFDIAFKKDAVVNIDDLKKAVEDAGFSVGKLKITGTFTDIKIETDQHVKIGNDNFHFLNVSSQVLNGEKTLTVIDKNFMTEKEFKKISASTKKSCLQTGKAASCCVKDGIPEGTRVYHVTI
jgi:copper chaperone CopZ